MNLYQAVSSASMFRLSMFLGQRTPEGIGHRLAWFLAGAVCWKKPAMYRNLQANLRQVLGLGTDQQILDRTTRQVFYHAIRSYYDLYRALRLSPEELAASVELPESSRGMIDLVNSMGRGTVVVLPHLGSFDLAGQVVASYVSELQVLTLPNPPPGFQLTNELRRRSGTIITPLTPAALRQSIQLLRRGGMVGVGGDRPVSELDEPLSFFGRPARMPSGHVRLALKTNATLVVVYCTLSPETQRYTLHIEPPMELVRTSDRNEEVRINMRRVLDTLEAIVRRWLEQWQMFVPVWPEFLEA